MKHRKLSIVHTGERASAIDKGLVGLEHVRALEQWDISNFTPPTMFVQDVQKYKVKGALLPIRTGVLPAGRPFRFMVHSIRTDYMFDFANSGGGHYEAFENAIANWDAISCSVIDQSWRYTFGGISFILEVPKQNVLLTNPVDLAFSNHMGTSSDPLYSNYSSAERSNRPFINGLLKNEVINRFDRVQSPAQMLSKEKNFKAVDTYYHNEVVAVGRGGVNIHPGLPATQKIKVVGVLLKRSRLLNSAAAAMPNPDVNSPTYDFMGDRAAEAGVDIMTFGKGAVKIVDTLEAAAANLASINGLPLIISESAQPDFGLGALHRRFRF
ncbi:hypothetical protein BOH74_04125 [Pseudomonas versuta]|uniref:Uncharacterized protein n=1 Tax=Pseudomonas versuta TaxID=1788301 RepID=A0A853ZX76_9PSED|nr:hypothetical protein [Pseudomonas versuta]OKA28002.1 hypothetical protein BOH74_04125 [Pseudomonas versuta]